MKIAKIIIHCSDSPDTLDIGVAEIRSWHVNDRGWADIGYHYVVRRSGLVEVGRYENGDSILEGKEIGAHVKGQNLDSLAICWVGRNSIAKEQREALIKHTAYLMGVHDLNIGNVYGHYEFNSAKTCPNLDMDNFRISLQHFLISTGVA